MTTYNVLDREQKNNEFSIERELDVIPSTEQEGFIDYTILPEDYNVFSELKLEMPGMNTDQKKFLEAFLWRLKWEIKKRLKYLAATAGETMKILPKLNISMDSDGAVIIDWAYAGYRIFIDIEKNIENSFYGVVEQTDKKKMHSVTDEFNESNYIQITNELLDYVFG